MVGRFLDFAHFVCYARNDNVRVWEKRKKGGDFVASLFSPLALLKPLVIPNAVRDLFATDR